MSEIDGMDHDDGRSGPAVGHASFRQWRDADRSGWLLSAIGERGGVREIFELAARSATNMWAVAEHVCAGGEWPVSTPAVGEVAGATVAVTSLWVGDGFGGARAWQAIGGALFISLCGSELVIQNRLLARYRSMDFDEFLWFHARLHVEHITMCIASAARDGAAWLVAEDEAISRDYPSTDMV